MKWSVMSRTYSIDGRHAYEILVGGFQRKKFLGGHMHKWEIVLK
jgi:hypothetical protein